MNKLSLIIAFCLVWLLTGCVNSNPSVVYKNVFVAMPDSLLLDCEITPPPPPTELKASNIDQFEQKTFDLNLSQVNNLKVCNKRLSDAREWQTKQKASFPIEAKP